MIINIKLLGQIALGILVPIGTVASAIAASPTIISWWEHHQPKLELANYKPLRQIWIDHESPSIMRSYLALDIQNISNQEIVLHDVGIASNPDGECIRAQTGISSFNNPDSDRYHYYPRYHTDTWNNMPFYLLAGGRTAQKKFGVLLILSDSAEYSFNDISAICVWTDLDWQNAIAFPVTINNNDVTHLIGPPDQLTSKYGQ